GLGPEGQRGVHPVQSLDLALSRHRHFRDRPRLQPLRRRPPRRPGPPPEITAPPASTLDAAASRGGDPTARARADSTARAQMVKDPDAAGGARGGSVAAGAKGPVPIKRRRTHQPGWSPAAEGKRTRAAWSSRPRPPSAPPPPPPPPPR